MYEDFFGFNRRPFDLTPNPKFLVLTDSHREALSNLEYGIASKKGITLLLGEAGSGKTTVIRAALERQPQRVHCVHLHNPTLTRDEFVHMLAARFELSEDAKYSKTSLLLELEALLQARRERDEATVLVIDEAQSLPPDLLEEIRLLANIETDDDKLVSVIIAGQPELISHLNDESLRQLKQRIALRCELRPLSLAGDGRLHRGTHPGGRRRRRAGVHARGGRAHSRAVARHSADDQRHRRQRSARRLRHRTAAGQQPARPGRLPGFRYQGAARRGCVVEERASCAGKCRPSPERRASAGRGACQETGVDPVVRRVCGEAKTIFFLWKLRSIRHG